MAKQAQKNLFLKNSSGKAFDWDLFRFGFETINELTHGIYDFVNYKFDKGGDDCKKNFEDFVKYIHKTFKGFRVVEVQKQRGSFEVKKFPDKIIADVSIEAVIDYGLLCCAIDKHTTKAFWNVLSFTADSFLLRTILHNYGVHSELIDLNKTYVVVENAAWKSPPPRLPIQNTRPVLQNNIVNFLQDNGIEYLSYDKNTGLDYTRTLWLKNLQDLHFVHLAYGNTPNVLIADLSEFYKDIKALNLDERRQEQIVAVHKREEYWS